MTEPNAEGIRTLTFEINGVMREIKVLDKHLEVKSDGKLKADKNNPWLLHPRHRFQDSGEGGRGG